MLNGTTEVVGNIKHHHAEREKTLCYKWGGHCCPEHLRRHTQTNQETKLPWKLSSKHSQTSEVPLKLVWKSVIQLLSP
ncbi:hypothetical protein AMELA_G00187240 [Ameiurus melas]|uniref:Uncharacterized protein n=1 Tax=Ameiurus melas TaxID=219545 RepID=A0A7J6A7W0_AMEME|nr:hypothetical protein AMELA_G00187240 [Ameiurus melas]